MRLQLAATLMLVMSAALFSTRGAAQSLAKLDTRAAVYQDTDRTTIVTNNVGARANPLRNVGVEARYLVDVITSASVDVITAATGAFHETRYEVEGGANYHDDARKVAATYVHSQEHDWESHTGTLAATQDLFHHALTLKLGGSYVANDVGRAGDPTFRRKLTAGSGSTGFTYVPSPEDLLDVTYSLSYLDGYQASPYRFVFFGGGAGPLATSAPETDPRTRMRHAVTARWNHHAFHDTVLRSHARGYVDDWGVLSATAGTEYVVGWGEIETGAFVRGYAQRRASFYQATYSAPMTYMTADRELSTFVDAFGGLRVAWRRAKVGFFEDIHAEAKASAFYFRFFDFPRLPERSGVIGELAFGVSF